MNILRRLELERDNCPRCNSDQHEIAYRSKAKRGPKCFKRLRCLICGYEWIAESNKEFNERIKDFIK